MSQPSQVDAYGTGIGRCIAALQEAVHQYATANREAGIPDDVDTAMKELRGYLVPVVRITYQSWVVQEPARGEALTSSKQQIAGYRQRTGGKNESLEERARGMRSWLIGGVEPTTHSSSHPTHSPEPAVSVSDHGSISTRRGEIPCVAR